MNNLSYIEDKNILAHCNETRDYSIIRKYIQLNKDKFTYHVSNDDSTFGYDIKRINQLSDIYGYDFFAVNFFFQNIAHYFNEKESKLMSNMVKQLNEDLDKNKGYYIIKIPSFNSMLIDQLNILGKKYIFAGGTVCYYAKSLNNKTFEDDGLTIKVATKEEKDYYKDQLSDLSKKSFENYFGQYHISSWTREKAPLIYRNWIEDYIGESVNKNLLIALCEHKVVGFIAFDETPYTFEAVLNCVDENYRGLKIYEKMLKVCVDLCLSKNKIVTISTQIDNYFPQRAWINSQFKPYNSFYLFHYNNIDDK